MILHSYGQYTTGLPASKDSSLFGFADYDTRNLFGLQAQCIIRHSGTTEWSIFPGDLFITRILKVSSA